jgi:hypothetical protein
MRLISRLRFLVHQAARKLFALLPKGRRHDIYRSFVDCDPAPNQRLVLKIADTKEELEACFKLLHDAYVSSGFMTPDPSGMRVTIYHALPTTTTLCAKMDDQVIGTLSLIRESANEFLTSAKSASSPVTLLKCLHWRSTRNSDELAAPSSSR